MKKPKGLGANPLASDEVDVTGSLALFTDIIGLDVANFFAHVHRRMEDPTQSQVFFS